VDSSVAPGKPDHVVRILMVTRSAGFKHSSVTNPDLSKALQEKAKADDAVARALKK
jgi:hypothetical protein